MHLTSVVKFQIADDRFGSKAFTSFYGCFGMVNLPSPRETLFPTLKRLYPMKLKALILYCLAKSVTLV
jgi:hypothetical protein